ncbi:MAG: hypothetical protein KDE32_06535 [Novosphingobium sp.]|nr:hypothetical protein [Novosphingobium sp.]
MANLLSRLGRLPIAPLAIPILVGLPIWQSGFNKYYLTYADVLPTILVLLAIVAALVVVVRYFVKSWMRASLIALVWTGYALYFPTFVRAFSTNTWVLLAAFAVGALLAWDISRRIPRDDVRLSRANGIANLVVWLPALFYIAQVTRQEVKLENGRPDPQQTFAAFPGKADANSPDVWHIVMDRYAGATTLKRAYHFDNSDFVKALRARGFDVADDAYSNYAMTPISLASTLNASYLDKYTPKLGNQEDIVPMFDAIEHSRAFDFFKKQGYEFIFSSSWADVTFDNALADRDINYRKLSEYPRIIIGQSVPGVIGALLHVPFTDGRREQCERAKYKFAELRKVAAEPGRKMVFAHFLVPHPPYTLKADGSCQDLAEASRNSRRDDYVGQIHFANRELLSLIDTILAGPRPATIVIHSDEGPYPAPFVVDEPEHPVVYKKGEKRPSVSLADQREKTSILLAIRHADGKSTGAMNSAINTYPVILNHSFGAHMPMKPDRTFFFASSNRYPNLKDITDDLRGGADLK